MYVIVKNDTAFAGIVKVGSTLKQVWNSWPPTSEGEIVAVYRSQEGAEKVIKDCGFVAKAIQL